MIEYIILTGYSEQHDYVLIEEITLESSVIDELEIEQELTFEDMGG